VIGHRREHGRDVSPQPGAPLLRARVFSLFGTADLWRVPTSWAGKTFGEIMRAIKRGEHRELPLDGASAGIQRLAFPLPLGIGHVHCYLLPA